MPRRTTIRTIAIHFKTRSSLFMLAAFAVRCLRLRNSLSQREGSKRPHSCSTSSSVRLLRQQNRDVVVLFVSGNDVSFAITIQISNRDARWVTADLKRRTGRQNEFAPASEDDGNAGVPIVGEYGIRDAVTVPVSNCHSCWSFAGNQLRPCQPECSVAGSQ